MRILYTFVLISAIILINTNCTSSNKTVKQPAPADQVKPELQPKEYWQHYSDGVHYKNQAIEAADYDSRKILIEKAIDSLKKSEPSAGERDKIYNQISDCYYIIGDLNNSLVYAKKSISVNKSNMEPYNRIYSIYIKFKMNREAAEILKEFSTVYPESVYIHFTLGEHYLRLMNDPVSAEKSFLKIIDLTGKNSVEDYYREYSYYYLGYIAYSQKKTDISMNYFKKVLNVNKTNINALYTLALINMENNNFREAEKYARAYYSINQANAKINSVLGIVYYIQDLREAADFLNKSSGVNTFEGFISKGLFLELINKNNDSEQIINAVLNNDQNLIAARIARANLNLKKNNLKDAHLDYLTAGLLLFNFKQYTEAEKYLLKAVNITQNDITYYSLARLYEDTGKPARAIYYYKKIDLEKVTEAEQRNDILLQIGLLYGARKKYDTADEYFNKVILSEPANSKPYFCKGVIKLQKKEYAGAEEFFKKSIELQQNTEVYHFYIAIVYEKTNRINDAINSLKTALSHNPESARSYNFLGYIYADQNIELDNSLKLILKALEIEPENGAYIDSLGWVYYRKGDYHTALEKLLEAEQLLADNKQFDPVVYDHLGDTYQKLGNTNMALKYWKKSLDLEQNDKTKDKIRQYDTNK